MSLGSRTCDVEHIFPCLLSNFRRTKRDFVHVIYKVGKRSVEDGVTFSGEAAC